MNNLLSNCGLVGSRISASEKDLNGESKIVGLLAKNQHTHCIFWIVILSAQSNKLPDNLCHLSFETCALKKRNICM